MNFDPHTVEFTLGVEEEYLIVDRALKSLVVDPSSTLFDKCRDSLGDQISQEMMRSQIEVVSRPHRNVTALRADLANLRGTVVRTANALGLAPIASGTHPFAEWSQTVHTDKQRYDRVVEDLQDVGRRLVINGLHVHVGTFPDNDLRIDLMNRVTPFLPLLLALSTSPPFWRGENTGLKCYRLAVYDQLPRTGLPEVFADWREYEDFTATLSTSGIIPDASMVWWAIRPSSRFPTVELRIADSCTRMEDSIAIAALYQCLMRHLSFHPETNRDYVGYRRLFIDENRWRAQRYGLDGSFLDWRRRRLVPFMEMLEETLALVGEDAAALDCESSIARLRAIATNGTSAHGQLRVYEDALRSNAEPHAALDAVVSWLEAETARDI